MVKVVRLTTFISGLLSCACATVSAGQRPTPVVDCDALYGILSAGYTLNPGLVKKQVKFDGVRTLAWLSFAKGELGPERCSSNEFLVLKSESLPRGASGMHIGFWRGPDRSFYFAMSCSVEHSDKNYGLISLCGGNLGTLEWVDGRWKVFPDRHPDWADDAVENGDLVDW